LSDAYLCNLWTWRIGTIEDDDEDDYESKSLIPASPAQSPAEETHR
jgi:hypothetical protein